MTRPCSLFAVKKMHLDPGRPPPRCQSPRCLTRRQCTSPELKSQICRRLAKAHCILNANISKNIMGCCVFPRILVPILENFKYQFFPERSFPPPQGCSGCGRQTRRGPGHQVVLWLWQGLHIDEVIDKMWMRTVKYDEVIVVMLKEVYNKKTWKF